jgi:hypothetical protein
MPTAPCFYIKEGEYIKGQLDLTTFPFVIGRARECNHVIDSSEISRTHAQFNFDHQQVVVRDLGSTNGTFLNGERLPAYKDYRLRANDCVSLANVCHLIFDDPATTAQLNYDLALAEGLRVEEASAQVFLRGKPLDPPLSPSQILLLQLIMRNEEVVVTREDIRQFVWGNDLQVSDQAIDALVSRLRKRLHEGDPEHEYIITRRGFGLIFRNRRLKPGNMVSPAS